MTEWTAVASFLFDHLTSPLAGWVIGILTVAYMWWDHHKRLSACQLKLVNLEESHTLEIATLRRIINALSKSAAVMRQKLIKAGQMEPEDDSDAQQILAELLYAKD